MKILDVKMKKITGCYTRVDAGLLQRLGLIDSDITIKIEEVKLVKPTGDDKTAHADSFIVKYITDLGKTGEVKVEQQIEVPRSQLALAGGMLKDYSGGIHISIKEMNYELIFDELLDKSTIISNNKILGHAAKKFLIFSEYSARFPVTIYIDGVIYTIDKKGKVTNKASKVNIKDLNETMKYLKAGNIPLYIAVDRMKITNEILKEEFEMKASHIKVLDTLLDENLYNHILLLPSIKY